MPKIGGTHDDTYRIDSIDKTYTFTKSFYGYDTSYHAIEEDGADNTIILHGTAKSPSTGFPAIRSSGDDVTIRIASDGVVRIGGSALGIYGASADLINEGTIYGSEGYGSIYFASSALDARFSNSGKILSEGSAVEFRGDRSVFTNERGALVSADSIAVWFQGAAGVDLKFINHGRLETASSYAVAGSDSNDTLINTGTIKGLVTLQNGNDVIDNRGGAIKGDIFGGDGNDTLITDDTKVVLLEYADDGNDTVKSTVSYTLTANVERLVLLGGKNIDGMGTAQVDTILGNGGSNVLWGYEGADRLDGKGGNDMLRGGQNADTFAFATGYDRDTIFLYEDGIDRIDISGWKAIGSANSARSHAQNHGDDVWISSGNDVLVIQDTQKNQLDGADFIF